MQNSGKARGHFTQNICGIELVGITVEVDNICKSIESWAYNFILNAHPKCLIGFYANVVIVHKNTVKAEQKHQISHAVDIINQLAYTLVCILTAYLCIANRALCMLVLKYLHVIYDDKNSFEASIMDGFSK